MGGNLVLATVTEAALILIGAWLVVFVITLLKLWWDR